MQIADAQSEVRRVYLGGLIGNGISGILWLISAALATWHSTHAAMWTLVIGGFAIYPLLSLVLRLSGRPAALAPGNPLRYLAIQVAFVLPVSMLLLAPVVAFRAQWFYPAMMILVGAHYLPFATLYGMKSFLALAAVLTGLGVVIALHLPGHFSLGGWVGGGVLIAFAFIGYAEWRRRRAFPVPA